MKIFIGGSRNISRLTPNVQTRLDAIMGQNIEIVIGDANGADKAVQDYLRANDYRAVEVFCTGRTCRNNQGHWSTRPIKSSAKRGTFDFYAAKDRAMAEEASLGLMLWDGKSKGTLMNASRLLAAGKSVVLYISSTDRFVDLKATPDFERFLQTDGRHVRGEIAAQITAESRAGNAQQIALL